MKKFSRAILIFIAFSVSYISAQENNAIPCKIDPASVKTNFPTHLSDIQDKAIELAPALCKNALLMTEEDSAGFREALLQYTRLAKAGVLSTFPEKDFQGITGIADAWEIQVNDFTQSRKPDQLNFILFIEDNRIPPEQSLFAVRLPPYHKFDMKYELTDALVASCKKTPKATDCKTAGKSVENAITPLYQPLKLAFLDENGEKLKKLQNDWGRFIDESRYQFPWEVWATTYLQKDKFNGKDLVGPPSYQAILLHPSIVIEHIDNLKNGNRDDVSLALEWAGVNWWDKGFGVSFTSVYTDRADTNSIGHGLTLHIKNNFSIGYVHRDDGNNSVFFNIDLLDWFGDKQEKYKKYKEYF